MPDLEHIVQKEKGMYIDRLKDELELYKKEISYEDIVKEIEKDMKIKRFRR